jgi:uncharacterized paraquat-inducible protein A
MKSMESRYVDFKCPYCDARLTVYKINAKQGAELPCHRCGKVSFMHFDTRPFFKPCWMAEKKLRKVGR